MMRPLQTESLPNERENLEDDLTGPLCEARVVRFSLNSKREGS
jgi:hypothetical protein